MRALLRLFGFVIVKRKSLEAIVEYGYLNSGCGYSCAEKVKELIGTSDGILY